MNKQDILKTVHAFYDARDVHTAAKLEIARMAVECGMPQQNAKDSSQAAAYLDGILVGLGHIPVYRRNADPTVS
jgi:hypothetical protein